MKVLIPTAGIGSRLGKLTTHYNKAMLPVGKRPCISHIIDQYPVDAEFLIALGYKGDHIRQYLGLAYRDRNITFVDVDKYEGPGTGLGYTLKQCRPYLDQEFVFHANDTLMLDEKLRFPMDRDTLLLHAGQPDPKRYRTVGFDQKTRTVTAIHNKTEEPLRGVYNYIGVAYVKTYEQFVAYLDSISVEIGESDYFMHRIAEEIGAYVVDKWYDIGNIEEYRCAQKELGDFQNLAKPDESIYFNGSRVYKFSVDSSFIAKRVKRARILKGLVPDIIDSSVNFYSYEYAPGELLSDKVAMLPLFRQLLDWSMSRLWAPIKLNHKEQNLFENTCFKFYYDKTMDRVDSFYGEHDIEDGEESINGNRVPSLSSILDCVKWSDLKRGVPVLWHGDYHFENILKTESGFSLLDWRQGFGDEIEYGDIYYDFAKLLHGLVVNHGIIRADQFTVHYGGGKVEFDMHRKHSLVECEPCLREFIVERGFSYKKTRILTALIFLNIAPLHHYPYSHFLYFLGKLMLWEAVESDDL